MSDAQTTANNALSVAQAAGFKPVLIFSSEATSQPSEYVYNLTDTLPKYKWLLFVLYTGYNEPSYITVLAKTPTAEKYTPIHLSAYVNQGFDNQEGHLWRDIKYTSDNTLTVERTYHKGNLLGDPGTELVVREIYGIA